MFTVDLSGLNRLIAQLEQRKLDYQVALDDAVDLARTTILNRVKLGQLVDGGYRVSNNPYNGSRYGERQFNYRKKRGLPTSSHNLFVTGELFNNFVMDRRQAIAKTNNLFVRTVGFTNRFVRGKAITYSDLAQIHENNTGVGFQLSPSQLTRVIARFKQVAKL